MRLHPAAIIAGGVAIVAGATYVLFGRGKRAKRVALIGDSLAVGLGPELQKIADASGVPFKSEGHIGSTVAQWLSTPSWGSWVGDFDPSVTLIELGTNDYLNPAPSLIQYRQLAAKFQNAIWIMPPDEPSTALTKVRDVISRVGVPVIPEMTGLPYGPDGFHPARYDTWAAFVWRNLP